MKDYNVIKLNLNIILLEYFLWFVGTKIDFYFYTEYVE